MGLAGAASLFSISDLTILDKLQLSGGRKTYSFHLELVGVMSVISALAVSKLIWPEENGRRSEPEKTGTLSRVQSKTEQLDAKYVPINGLDFALK